MAAVLQAHDASDGKPAGRAGETGPAAVRRNRAAKPPGAGPVIPELSTADALGKCRGDSEIAEAVTPAAGLAASVAADAEVAAPPHAIADAVTHLPMLLMITRDIAWRRRDACGARLRADGEPGSALPN